MKIAFRSINGRVMIRMQRTKEKHSVCFLTIAWTAVLTAGICLIFTTSGLSSDNEAGLWKALRSGSHFAIMRHAIAPGTGDPPHFTLDECSTQRNLSDEGRDQAKKIGVRFRANGIQEMRVFSSQWCRCLETARLLSLGTVQELPALNSFFEHREHRDSQTQMLKDWIKRQQLDHALLLVTHQVNITALTNIYPDPGELVIVHRSATGDFSVIGTIETN